MRWIGFPLRALLVILAGVAALVIIGLEFLFYVVMAPQKVDELSVWGDFFEALWIWGFGGAE